MPEVVNTAQAAAWNGYEGRHWAEHADRYDAVNSGFNHYLLDRVGEGDRVLDLGCGNGQLTRLAAGKAAHTVGIDLSEPMLARAREGATDVRFIQGDVQVHPFETGAFDLALSRFGVMFYADPVAAFANVRRALAPGGRLAFLCMTALAGTDLGAVLGALVPHLPFPTGADGAGPTSLADPERVHAVLGAAGFVDIACEHVEADQVWGADVADAAAFMGAWGPVKHHMDQVTPDAAARARVALAEALTRHATSEGVRMRGTAWLVTATR
ncbi:class I SAM-dependent methyltransferase [Actinokineospora sp. UTMC 2448]|uniref:class I SAM-dependent methyltransferase n=1 Tax=Actinokineospora sp. UTMC 2448 TaxID=2268449 RepID=UPI0021640F52|nr:class I SAM-dependent methyltransferase [Actinokineospora sp. UTMC 2448]UVS80675.1 Malonyl-CoA O-methyltransferase BioC [Actinokineospora sp. UTMC 2448]